MMPVSLARPCAALAALLFFAAPPAAAQGLVLTRVESDAALSALLPAPSVRLQARAGNRAPGGPHELAIHALSGGPAVTAQHAWHSGQSLPLRVTYDGFGYLTLVVGGVVLSRTVDESFSSLAVRASSRRAGASVRAEQLRLNHDWLGAAVVASSSKGESDMEALLVQGANLSMGFVLRGELRLTWKSPPPKGDELVLEVCLGDLVDAGQDYCAATPNSTGASCDLSWSGVTSISADALALHASGGVPRSACLFIMSDTYQALPLGNGWLCVGPPIQRLSDVLTFDAAGGVSLAVSLATGPLATGALAVSPGELRTFQLWYRDPLGTPEFYNLSDALALTFLP